MQLICVYNVYIIVYNIKNYSTREGITNKGLLTN